MILKNLIYRLCTLTCFALLTSCVFPEDPAQSSEEGSTPQEISEEAVSEDTVNEVDTVRPTLAITMDDKALNASDTATVTFTFSEAPTGFAAGDISSPSGTLSAPVVDGSNPLVYTSTFTPAASTTDATNVIIVNTNWTDAAGNAPASASTSANYTVDTAPPVEVGGEDKVIDFQLSVEYKTESDYGYVSLTWPPVEGAEEYTVYSAKEPIITLVYMDDINQLEQGSRQTVTSNFINLDSFAQGDLYFYVISSNNKLSNQLKTKKIPVNTMGQNRVELTIDENMQPRVLAPITHTLISQSDITRGRLDGYSVSDFKGRIVTIDDIPLLQVTNNTPREFADINFVLNGQGYTLNQQVSQFSSLDILLPNIELSTADEVHVLDPNPAYRPDVSYFSESNTEATLLNYYLRPQHNYYTLQYGVKKRLKMLIYSM